MFTALTLGVLFSYSRAAWANMAVAIGLMLVVIRPPAGGRPARHRGFRVAHRRGRLAVGVIAVTGSLGFLQERARVPDL